MVCSFLTFSTKRSLKSLRSCPKIVLLFQQVFPLVLLSYLLRNFLVEFMMLIMGVLLKKTIEIGKKCSGLRDVNPISSSSSSNSGSSSKAGSSSSSPSSFYFSYLALASLLAFLRRLFF